jgi:hypothetical protein
MVAIISVYAATVTVTVACRGVVLVHLDRPISRMIILRPVVQNQLMLCYHNDIDDPGTEHLEV